MSGLIDNLSKFYYGRFRCQLCGCIWSQAIMPRKGYRSTEPCPMGCKNRDGSDTGRYFNISTGRI